ncbi:MAG: hypothetical protein E7536_05610 [Ruminococcaceae bacterium]|nr:hypothetical protein [Oscillospiraceae bacterium]
MKRFLCILISIIVLSGCSGRDTATQEKLQNEIRAIWISVFDMSPHFQGISEGGFRAKAENMFKDIKAKGFNHVFLQVRPYGDAFYKSDIFPWSKFISGEQGKSPGYDPLNIFIDVAHSHNLKIHAWINPYRISSDKNITSLSENNPARKMHEENQNDIYICEKGIFYNPASMKVQKLILDGVRELIHNYNIDGIHIDDFFYPVTDEEIDKSDYSRYKTESGKLSLTEFRREQVNAFVSGMYSIAKNKSKSIIVSISPCADYDENMNRLFADVKSWSTKDGFCDWIIPQVYYGFENEKMPYKEVVEEWRKLVTNKNKKLIIGLACYKCGQSDYYAGEGRDEWEENNNILSEQLLFLRKKDCNGFALFSYGSLSYPNESMEKEWENFSSSL